MPDKDSITKFKNQYRSTKVPFNVQANFEAFTKPIRGCEPTSYDSFTNKYQRRKPCGFCYHIVCLHDKPYSQELVIYSKDCGGWRCCSDLRWNARCTQFQLSTLLEICWCIFSGWACWNFCMHTYVIRLVKKLKICLFKTRFMQIARK